MQMSPRVFDALEHRLFVDDDDDAAAKFLERKLNTISTNDDQHIFDSLIAVQCMEIFSISGNTVQRQ